MNYINLVGRLVDTPILETDYEKGKKTAKINIAVNRCYKNEEGYYETDFFTILLLDAKIAEPVCEFTKKGDVIGIAGTLENRYTEDHKKYNVIIATKVSFISSRKEPLQEIEEETEGEC